MTKATKVPGVGMVHLAVGTTANGPPPSYSDPAIEALLLEATSEPIHGVLLKEFRAKMKELCGWKARAEKAEKQLAKIARENAIYLMFKRGLTQRQISEATGLAFPQVNLVLKRIRVEREGHTGSAGQHFEAPTGNRPYRRQYENELKALARGEDVAPSADEGVNPVRPERHPIPHPPPLLTVAEEEARFAALSPEERAREEAENAAFEAEMAAKWGPDWNKPWLRQAESKS